MDGSDAFGSSTAPLTWHDFLERMRHPSAADFVKSIKSFIVSFSNNVSDPEKDSAAVQDFLTNMEVAFRAHSLWAGCSEEELESAGEGLEKYVMTKLFTRAFASLPEDVKRDDELSEKMALIQQFIRPENLDIKPTFQNETSWLLAQKELQKINKYKAPRDKLACILSCCKAINNSLLSASIASNENPPGADEFLPVLIYVTIKANPPQLHSNLLYIQRYRRQSRLVSEAAYFFTNILSAESFISSINAQSLSMDETEFENNMESARALLLGLSTDLESFSNERNQDAEHLSTMEAKKDRNSSPLGMGNPLPPQASSKKAESKDPDEKDRLVTRPSISDLEKEGAADLLKEDQVSRSFREYPFLYAHVGDLTINDVEDLLNSYKQLVLKYVSLSKGMAMSNPPIPFTQTESRKEFDDSTVVGTNDEQYKETRMTEEVFDGNSLIDINSESKLHPDESVTYPSGEDGDIH